MSRGFYSGDHRVSSVTDRSSKPNGQRPPYSWILAPKTGMISTFNDLVGTGNISSAQGQAGLFATATLSGVGTISNASLGLIVQMLATLSGVGGLTAGIIGQIQATATIAGTGNLSATISALAGLTATLVGTGNISATALGRGNMAADIYVNSGAASTQQLVNAIWDELTSAHTTAGTFGKAMTDAGSAGNPWTDTTDYAAGTKGADLKLAKTLALYLAGDK